MLKHLIILSFLFERKTKESAELPRDAATSTLLKVKLIFFPYFSSCRMRSHGAGLLHFESKEFP
jgi:hypothetical protein